MKTIEEFLSELSDLDIRIWVEAGSLRINAPQGVLTSDLQAELARRRSEILTFLLQMNLASESDLLSIQPVAQDGVLPLSFAQQRLWFLDQLEPGGHHYQIARSNALERDSSRTRPATGP